MPEGSNRTCEGCQGEITPNQIISRQAGLVGGVLLCPGCIARKRDELMRARSGGNHAPAAQSAPRMTVGVGGEAPADAPPQGRVWFPPEKKSDDGEDSLSLVDEVDAARETHQIRSFSEGSSLAGVHRDSHFQRPLAGPAEPATRCRTFHGKLTAAGLSHMDEQINEWLDANPALYIKSSTSTVGVFEGKSKEPHLLVTVFY